MLMNQALKVAYLLTRFPHTTETFIMREMYWIREQEVEVHIFSLLNPKEGPVHQQARELLPSVRYGPHLSWGVARAHLHYLRRSPGRYLRALARVIRQTHREPRVLARTLLLFPKTVYFARQMEGLGIDHVHAHFVWLEGLAAGVVRDLLGIPFTINPHAFDLFERDQQDVRAELENASRVIAISGYHRDYMARLCPGIPADSIQLVHCGLEADRFQPVPRQSDRGRCRILSVGRLVDKKGHQHLVDACSLLARRGIDFHCDIVGHGPLKDTLQASIERHGLQDRVALLGALDQHQILELYQSSDLFTLPCVVSATGDQDGIPVSLMEAMACQLPVVTTAVAGIPELVQHEQSGLLVRQADPSELADALERLITDPSLRRKLGEQARRVVLAEFQVQDTTARLASIFREVNRERANRTRTQMGTVDMATAEPAWMAKGDTDAS